MSALVRQLLYNIELNHCTGESHTIYYYVSTFGLKTYS